MNSGKIFRFCCHSFRNSHDPRLLEWLDWVLQDQQLELQVILDAMDRTTEEFRESILAETLLKQQSEDLRQLFDTTWKG